MCTYEMVTGILPESPFFNLPVLVYEQIFSHLNLSTIIRCRSVCTEWYTVILKLYSKPNGFCIRGKRKFIGDSARYLEDISEKTLKMKDYEDSQCPVENLKLENVNISDCLNLLEKSPKFRHTVEHVTHLNLTNVFLQDGISFDFFLSQFKRLRKLGIIHASLNALEEFTFLHYYKGYTYSLSKDTNLPETLKSVYIEMRQNSAAVPLICGILIGKKATLEEFQVVVIPSTGWMLQNTIMRATRSYFVSTVHRNAHFIRLLLANILKNSEISLKSLRIDWQMNDTIFTLEPNQEVAIFEPTHNISKFFEIFQPYTQPDNRLRLSELSLKLGNIFARYTGLTGTMWPVIALQVKRDLRKVVLSKLQTVVLFPPEIYEQIFYDYTELLDYKFYAKFVSEMTMSLHLDLTLLGIKIDAQVNKIWLQTHYSLMYIRELSIKIIPSVNEEPPALEFAEWLPNYILEDGNNVEHRIFCHMKTLKIHCEIKQLNSFNFFRISLQCPFLHELEIMDGPPNTYDNKTIDKEKISSTQIRDCDLRYIISKLKFLRTLTIWANMELITDFAITGCSSNMNILTYSFVNGHKIKSHFEDTVPPALENEAKMEINSSKYKLAMENIIASPISGLKQLKKLSLRGVGDGITDKIISSFISENGYCCFRKLETLEIFGLHQISKGGIGNLRKVIKEVIL